MTLRELHKKFVSLGNEHRKILYKLQTMIPEINKLKVWESYHCGSIFEYAAKYAGIGAETVKKALNICEKIKDRPVLMRAVEAVGVTKVGIALRLIGTDEEIAKKAMTMSKKSLELFAREKTFGVAAEQKMIVEFTPEMQKMFYLLKKKLNARTNQEAVILMMRECLENEVKKGGEASGELANSGKCDEANGPGIVKKIIKGERGKLRVVLKKTTRSVDEKNKKIVWQRSGGTCEYPGCTKVAENLHHKIPWKINKSHDSLISLCKEHHEIVHVTGSSYVDFEFRQKRKEILCV